MAFYCLGGIKPDIWGDVSHRTGFVTKMNIQLSPPYQLVSVDLHKSNNPATPRLIAVAGLFAMCDSV